MWNSNCVDTEALLVELAEAIDFPLQLATTEAIKKLFEKSHTAIQQLQVRLESERLKARLFEEQIDIHDYDDLR